MTTLRITKRTVDALQSSCNEFTVWDNAVTGFGVRVRATGAKSYVVVYRAGAGRGAPVRRYTIAAVGKITPERARTRAKIILGAVALGHDPANQKTAERGMPTVAELADSFMSDHVTAKRQGRTAEFYRDILGRIVNPAVGTSKADKLTRGQVGRLHSSLADTPFQANRVLAVSACTHSRPAQASCRMAPIRRAALISSRKTAASDSLQARNWSGWVARSGKVRRPASPGQWMNPRSTPSTCRRPSARLRSAHRRQRRFGSFFSLGAGYGRFCTYGGSMSIWSAAVSSCPTARAAGRPSFSMLLPSPC
jgi:hypothetical protein